MYEFVTGPLAWFSFSIFFVGIIVRTVLYVRDLNRNRDRDSYTNGLNDSMRRASRSILFWLFPFAMRSQRNNLGLAILVFIFRVGLVFTPIFLLAHNIILKERWGLRLWTLPEATSDILTIAVIISAVFLILRCVALPQVRIITTAYDYLLLAIFTAPFITGFLAYHQVPDYKFWLIVHIICGEIMLIAFPFTRLSRPV